MADHLRTELVLTALDMALWNRRPAPEVIQRSDHGCQYPALAFGCRCQEARVIPSLGSRGDCFDHAITESFFATVACELLHRSTFRTQTQARKALFDYIEGFYNTHRRHSALGNVARAEYERCAQLEAAAFETPSSSLLWVWACGHGGQEPRYPDAHTSPTEGGQPVPLSLLMTQR